MQKRLLTLLALALLLASPVMESATAASPPIKTLAKARGILFGSAVEIRELYRDAAYAKFVRGEFSVVTPEYEFKMKAIAPARGKLDFKDADRLVTFALKNRLLIRGHTLVWHNPDALPEWMKERKFTREELRGILKNHIQRTIKHFRKTGRGSVFCWDVANEIFDSDGRFRTDSVWAGITTNPVEFLTLVFRWAHEADPKIKLFYNEYDIESPGKKFEAVYKTLQALRKARVPIHGIGFQMHHGPDRLNLPATRAIMKKFAALGLTIHITEYDFALRDSERLPDAFERQASAYSELATLCTSIKACKAFTTWGFTDRDSWIPETKPGLGRATFLDGNLAPKPAYYSLKRAFSAGFKSQSK